MEALADQYRALREDCGVVTLSRQGVRVTGDDRASFVHGMVTNEVAAQPDGSWSYSALCTAKGAMVADARVLKFPDFIHLDTEPGFGAKLKAHLEKFLISEDAELADANDRTVLLVAGPKAAAALSAFSLPEGARVSVVDDVWILTHALYGVPCFELFVPTTTVAEVRARISARDVSAEALELLRVEAGLGRMGVDMEENVTIPLEANLERGINYKKGCYIGQEVIARATFRGAVNKKLVGLKLPSGARAGTQLKKGEKVIGRVTSVIDSPRLGHVGLGYVHRTLLDVGTEVELDGGGKATVAALPLA